jgi:hypothetical protein
MIHQGVIDGHVGAAYDDGAVLAVRVDTNQSDSGGGNVGEYQWSRPTASASRRSRIIAPNKSLPARPIICDWPPNRATAAACGHRTRKRRR